MPATLDDIPLRGYTTAAIADRFNALLPLARAGRNIITYNDAAGVLAETSPLAPGTRLLTAQGHGYIVAETAATGHHVTRADGLKLYVLPGADGCFSVDAFGAAGNGLGNDAPAFQRIVTMAAALGKPITAVGRAGATYRLTTGVTMAVNGLVFDLRGATVQTVGDIVAFEVGAPDGVALKYEASGVLNAIFMGSGSTFPGNRALVVRNHSHGRFIGNQYFQFGGKPILLTSYGRGNQYNTFRDGEIKGNYRGAWEIDSGTVAGSYVTDNLFDNIRAHENPKYNGGGQTQGVLKGTGEMGGNRFNNCALESIDPLDTLLDLQAGKGNLFWGLRLDGDSATRALNIAAGAKGNTFFLQGIQGTVNDDSGASIVLGDRGTEDLPYMQFGSVEHPATSEDPAFAFQIARPGDLPEMHLTSHRTNGVFRVPGGTLFFVGDRDGGDNAAVSLDGTNRRLTLATTPSRAAGTGGSVRFDGRFSQSGNLGTADFRQDANGVGVVFSDPGKMLHSSGSLSVPDGITAPAAVAGRAVIYVDSADGDLKVVFGDGTVKTIITDTP